MPSDSYLSFLGRVFILSMVTFGRNLNPSICFKQFDDLYDLIRFHYYYFLRRKGNKNNTISKIFWSKSISFNTILISFAANYNQGNNNQSYNLCRISIYKVRGVHQEVVDASDGCLEIPQLGTKHSMNVSITAGIIIYKFVESLIL